MWFLSKIGGGGVSFTGILDTYTGASGAWSVRWLNSAYTGALMRIRRSSDNAEKDFYPDTNNELSLNSEDGSGTSLSTWITTDSGYVVKWYGQETAGATGAGNDAVQGTAASQPRIVNAGSLETDPNNGKVALFFDSSDDYFSVTSISVTQNYYNSFVYNRGASLDHSIGLCGSGNPYPFLWYFNDTIYSGTPTTTAHDTSQTQTGDFLNTTLRDGSNNVKMWQNGSAKTTKTNTGTTGTFTYLGTRGAARHYNEMQECIHWSSDQESNRSGIESDVNAFYSIW